MQIDRFHLIIFFLAVFWYVLTAFNSNGYYHPDEHYQLIEFARFKLEVNQAYDLAWEYSTAMRSAFQPAICFVIFKMCSSLGLKDPYVLSFILRLLTVALTLSVIRFFVRRTISEMPESYHKAYILLSYFLWFLPFVNVRFSSETWSGIFILLAIAFVQNKRAVNVSEFWLCGVAVGLAFLCRFQAAVMGVGLLLWLICVKRIRFRMLLVILSGSLLILFLGTLLDQWMYGRFELTAWNYFRINLIEDVASSFGVSPWYEIIHFIISAPVLLLGIFILLSIVIAWSYRPDSPYLWVITPLIVVHACIAHKELRFLFPSINFMPVIIIVAVAHLRDWWEGLTWPYRMLSYTLLTCFLIINLTGLIVLGFKAAGAGRADVTRYIYRSWNAKHIQLVYENGRNPYKPWKMLREGHHEQGGMTLYPIEDFDQLDKLLSAESSTDTVRLIVLGYRYQNNTWLKDQLVRHKYVYRMQGVSEWIIRLNNLYHGFNADDVFTVYELESHRK